jgi:hypothetical protein
MKGLFFVLLLLSSVVHAAPQIVTAQGLNAVKYTPMTYNLKKLITTIADARLAFPGEEVFVGADQGYPFTGGPVSFGGLFTYHVAGGLFYGIDQGPKVAGFNPTGLSNFLVRPTSVSPSLLVTAYFNRPTTEVGAYFATTNAGGGVFADAVTISVNGVVQGSVDLPAFQATYVGVRDEESPFFTDIDPSNTSNRTVTFTTTLGGVIAPFVADGVYIELTGTTPAPVPVVVTPVVPPVTPPAIVTPTVKVKGKLR